MYRFFQDLLYVVPFVAKVLEGCAESKVNCQRLLLVILIHVHVHVHVCVIAQVFKPPNPWVMAIMAVLAELHAVQELKVWQLHEHVPCICKWCK